MTEWMLFPLLLVFPGSLVLYITWVCLSQPKRDGMDGRESQRR